MKIETIDKFIVAASGAAGEILSLNLAHGELKSVLLTIVPILSALGVYFTPNKTIVAAPQVVAAPTSGVTGPTTPNTAQ